MDRQSNPCALKGGTALRLKMGLTRWSDDLDFEGDKRIAVRKSVTQGLTDGLPDTRWQAGRIVLRGTVKLWTWDPANGWTRTTLDYRRTGTRAGMPDRVPVEDTERVDGIAIYTDAVLVRRKLATIIGEKPREAARDVYDAGWIITQHPELLDGLMRTKLRAWLGTIDDRRTRRLRRRLERDKRTRRVSAAEVLALLEESILAL